MQQVVLFSLESFESHFGLVLNSKRMNQKAKPHKRSLVEGDQNDILVLGLCRFVSEEFDHNDLTLIALYYCKIRLAEKEIGFRKKGFGLILTSSFTATSHNLSRRTK